MRTLTIALITLSLLILSASTSALSLPFQSGTLMSFPTSSTGLEPFNMFSLGSVSGSPATIPSKLVINSRSIPMDQFSGTDPGNNKWIDHTFVPTASPNPVADAYFNAPSITQEQKDRALNIASTSDVYKKYIQYPNSGWTYTWTYPYTGAIHLSTTISPNNPSATVYGQLSFDVDINKGTVINAGFGDWHNTW